MGTWYGGWTSLLTPSKHSQTQTESRIFFCFELFLATPEAHPNVPNSVLRLPLNLQPSHFKLHQKDVLSTSIAVSIEGAFCMASYPNIIAGGIDLCEVVSWALLCCAVQVRMETEGNMMS